MAPAQEEFQGWLQRGLGRAVLFLQQHDAVPYRNMILNACVHNLAYDPQVEGNRARFLYDVIQATGEIEVYATCTRDTLATTDDRDSQWQLYDLSVLLAKNGDQEARRVIYQTFARHVAMQNYAGADAPIELDGLEGFLFVVHQTALYPLSEEDQWLEETYVDTLEEHLGKDTSQAALDEAAANDPVLAAFLTRVRERQETQAEARKQRPRFVVPDAAKIQTSLSRSPRSRSRYLFKRWGRDAEEATLRVLAQDVPGEDKPETLLNWLALFYWRAYPFAPDVLLRYARSTTPDIADAACAALAHISAPSVRALALDLLTASDRPWDGATLIAKNFLNGDYQCLETVVARQQSADELHWLGRAALRCFKAHPSPHAVSLLTLLYEKDPCSFCRNTAIDHLLSLGPLPDWMVAECRYDADRETRKLVTGEQKTERE